MTHGRDGVTSYGPSMLTAQLYSLEATGSISRLLEPSIVQRCMFLKYIASCEPT